MKIYSALFCLILFVPGLFGQDRYDLVKYPDLEEGTTVFDILLRPDGSVYLGTDRGLLFINSFEEIPREIIRDKKISALCESPDRSFYFGGSNMFGNSSDFQMYYLDDRNADIQCMVVHEDKLWIGTNNGLYEINPKNLTARKQYTVRNSKLPDPFVNFLYSDKFGILWIGTRNGVVRANEDSWKSYEKNSMEGIFENREGLWLLNENELWNIDNVDRYNRWYRANLQDGLKKGKVNDIVIDSDDRLLIASDILVRFDPYTDRIERYGDDLGLISQKCLALQIDDHDKMWIGTENDGLYTVGFKARERLTGDRMPLELAMVGKAPSCTGTADGSMKLNIKGGKAPYGITWSNGEKDRKQIFGLEAGQYRVTVTDTEGESVSGKLMLIDPRELSIELDEMVVDELDPENTLVSFVFDGGSPGYLLDINGINTSNPVKGLTPGNHVATVTDIMGCRSSLEFSIEGETDLSKLDASNMKVGQVVRIDKLFFATDSTHITSTSLPVLNEVYEFLQNNQNIVIEVGGHTNGLPPHDYCDRLSTERAKNVASHLINRGIDSSRVSYKGYGKRVPIATNKTVAGRKRNQRVEIKILSLGD